MKTGISKSNKYNKTGAKKAYFIAESEAWSSNEVWSSNSCNSSNTVVRVKEP